MRELLKKYQNMVNAHIPLTKYMEWSIQSISPQEIKAITQLTPNINVHGTAYAGSIYAAAMATGWTLMKCWYDHHEFQTELVAAEANIKYLAPVSADFECESKIDLNSPKYLKLYERMQESRSCGYPLIVNINCNNKTCAILEVNYVFKCH